MNTDYNNPLIEVVARHLRAQAADARNRRQEHVALAAEDLLARLEEDHNRIIRMDRAK